MGMARSITAILLALCAASTSAMSQASDDAIVGTWLTEAGDSKVEIAKSGAAYTGKVVWLKRPERNGQAITDARNADPAQRGRPIMGLAVLPGVSPAGNGTWSGTIYSPNKGRSYPVELSVAKDGRLDLKVKDGMFSKHVLWTRAH